ncbi:MAG TPA: hypothetical protein VJ306_01195 [Pyrinomonadaceae bacterium]|jgi:hypothetical protein|nr:hypothetical protein [Pyrinomonadaceae bacterium]
MKRLLTLTLALGLFSFSVLAQDQPATQQPSTEDQEKEKAQREANAYRLLDQVIDEAQSLRLAENRIRIQIVAGDMLWDQNQARARSLFSMAAESVAELARTQVAAVNRRGTGAGPNFAPTNLRSFQLRQELVLTAARHDASLAYQLLAATKTPVTVQVTDDARSSRTTVTSDDGLEQALLSRVALLDPKLAAQNADLMLDKGQFPFSLPQVIAQLQKQDADAANKLTDKMVKKLQATNLLTTPAAGALVQTMLVGGPRPAGEPPPDPKQPAPTPRGWPSVLEQSAYVDLLSTLVDAALKATPGAQTGQRPGRPMMGRTPVNQQPPTDAQQEQNNARRMLANLQNLMPMVDQYLPGKASQVRQKMTELGMQPNSMAQLFNGSQGEPTADALVQAAATAPQQMQSRIYQQAAYKALEEGDTDRARQIATDHLQSNARDAVMKRIDFREMTKKAEAARIEDVRQAAAKLQSDNEKLDLLLQVATDTQKSNPKLALQVLEDARQLTNHRATGYEHFEQQLKVAHAFASVDPARSFEVMDPGISHLNELLSAAALLSGFEMNMFRDGEMAIQSGNGLTSTINRFGQELALLARSDFERSESLAGRFQFPEARIMVRMAIVQGLLGIKAPSGNTRFVGPQNGAFIRQD